MVISFNADEIFEMAQQIERNGAKFYRKAAGNISDADQKSKLLDLATMEDAHLLIFTRMREALTDADRQSMVSDPFDESALYLQAIADGYIFDVKADPSDLLAGKESLADILRIAIGLEKDSIVFYMGIRSRVPEHLGKDKIDRIIAEEMKHVVQLSGDLANEQLK